MKSSIFERINRSMPTLSPAVTTDSQLAQSSNPEEISKIESRKIFDESFRYCLHCLMIIFVISIVTLIDVQYFFYTIARISTMILAPFITHDQWIIRLAEDENYLFSLFLLTRSQLLRRAIFVEYIVTYSSLFASAIGFAYLMYKFYMMGRFQYNISSVIKLPTSQPSGIDVGAQKNFGADTSDIDMLYYDLNIGNVTGRSSINASHLSSYASNRTMRYDSSFTDNSYLDDCGSGSSYSPNRPLRLRHRARPTMTSLRRANIARTMKYFDSEYDPRFTRTHDLSADIDNYSASEFHDALSDQSRLLIDPNQNQEYETSFNAEPIFSNEVSRILYSRDINAIIAATKQDIEASLELRSSRQRSVSTSRRSMTPAGGRLSHALRSSRGSSVLSDITNLSQQRRIQTDRDLSKLIRQFRLPPATDVTEQLLFDMYDIGMVNLLDYEGRLRQYIRNTILQPLLLTIDEVNARIPTLTSTVANYGTLRVGESSLERLKDAASTLCISGANIQLSASLYQLLPYLNYHPMIDPLPTNYTGKEVIDLCRTLYASSIDLDSAISDRLSDAKLLLHIFVTYMNSMAPPDARFVKEGAFRRCGLLNQDKRDEIGSQHVFPSAYYLVVNQQQLYLAINGGTTLFRCHSRHNAVHQFYATIVLMLLHCKFYANAERLPASIDANMLNILKVIE